MATNFDATGVNNLIGLWDFREGAETADTGLDDGIAQDGTTTDNPGDGSNAREAEFDDGFLVVGAGSNSHPTVFDVDADPDSGADDAQFNLDRGTLEVQFIQTKQSGGSEDVIVSRGEKHVDEHDEGFFEIRVTKDGRVEAFHNTDGGDAKVTLSTHKDTFEPGDEVNVKYVFDTDTGARLIVENLTTGTAQTVESDQTGLSFDLTDDDDEEFTFGAREAGDGHYDKEFVGKIDYVALYESRGDTTAGEGGDGYVEGSDGNDLIDVTYSGDPEGDQIDAGDAILPGEGPDDDIVLAGGGDDEVKAGEGDDDVYGGAGNDELLGGAGDDRLYGDGDGPAREVFQWSEVADGSAAPISQDTGTTNVTFTITDPSAGDGVAGNEQLVDGINTGPEGAPADDRSSYDSLVTNHEDTAAYDLSFDKPVEAVSFRINDIDIDSQVAVTAFVDGQPVEVILEGGDNLDLTDTDGVAGDDTATSVGGNAPDTSPDYSVLVSVPGPVDQIVIDHVQDGAGNSGVNITDVYFDAGVTEATPGGDDTLMGGDGDDLLDGGGGDDTLRGQRGDDTLLGGAGDDDLGGAEGDDTLVGGDGDDSLTGGSGDDTIDGGEGNDTVDAGSGDDDVDGGAGDDQITTGDGNDTVDGGDGDDVIDTSGDAPLPDIGFPGYGPVPPIPADGTIPGTSPFDDRDTVFGGAGDDTITTGDDQDVIDGGDGDDTIDSGIDDDTVLGGAGDDTIISGEGNDTVEGGDGDDLIYGGLGPSVPDTLNIEDDGSNASGFGPDPVPNNGKDVLDGGAGNDTIFGEDDDDLLIGGTGDDFLDGGIDDDTLLGGEGDDTLRGGQGIDQMEGGDDVDTFVIDTEGDGTGDTVIGGEGGVDNDTLDLSGYGPNKKVVFDEDLAPGDKVDPGGTPGEAGKVVFYDGAGFEDDNIVGEMSFSEIENVIPCFTPGALIATPRGEVPVETLRQGDTVITRDNGIQEIRWIGRRDLTGRELMRAPTLRPILVKKGALGDGLPERDMMVSPQHRMLVSSDRTQLFFDESEVLVAAKHLVDHGGIRWAQAYGTSYVHFMFDQHEVVLADGCWTESFQPGDLSLGSMGDGQRNEIFQLFPNLREQGGRDSYQAARRALRAHEARLLVR